MISEGTKLSVRQFLLFVKQFGCGSFRTTIGINKFNHLWMIRESKRGSPDDL